MHKIFVPKKIFQAIMSNKDYRKLFVIYLQIKTNLSFPVSKISLNAKMSMAKNMQVSLKTVYNVIRAAQFAEIIYQKKNKTHIINEKQFYALINISSRAKSFTVINFDSIKPMESLIEARILESLSSQEHAIKNKLWKRSVHEETPNILYDKLINSIQSMEYSKGIPCFPPTLTQLTLAKMLGLKSTASGHFYKMKLLNDKIINIHKMKKKKYSHIEIKKGGIDFKKNPPDFATINLKKTDRS